MSDTTKHTPLPWEYRAASRGITTTMQQGAYSVICRMAESAGINAEERAANAAFIVKAVNSHQALVDALEALMECAGGQYSPGYDEAFDKATAALELAKDKA